MKIKKLAISLLAFLMFSGVLMTTVSAVAWAPSLPTDPATIEITNPYTTPLCPSSYPFIIDLSNVDPGFDITDGTYNGWCIDIDNGITREVPYDVMLYSSYDGVAPIPDEDWDRINYIINHQQGTGCDVQAAIWYFINGGSYWWVPGDLFDPSGSVPAMAMVADASTIGVGYEPGEGDILAIVCVPLETYEPPVQIVIIELEIPRTGTEGLTPGFWKNCKCGWVGYSRDMSFFNTEFGTSITINQGKKGEIIDPTFDEALRARGGINEEEGIYDALARHAVAALLNAAHPYVNYPMTEAEIIAAVADAINNLDNTDAEPLKDMLESYNELGGGIDAHGNPI